jgi:hypothetical protein
MCDVIEWCLGLFRRRQLSDCIWDRKESREKSEKKSAGNRNKNLSASSHLRSSHLRETRL